MVNIFTAITCITSFICGYHLYSHYMLYLWLSSLLLLRALLAWLQCYIHYLLYCVYMICVLYC